jgi:hypothetical protein
MENAPPKPSRSPRSRRSGNEQLLAEIAAFCQRIGMAESTFGRRVVNDGKLVSRLRFGGRVTTQTVDRVQAFMARTLAERGPDQRNGGQGGLTTTPSRGEGRGAMGQRAVADAARSNGGQEVGATGEADVETRFRFFDNRQKYLLFVSTCTEKGRAQRTRPSSIVLGRAHRRCGYSTQALAMARS